MDETEAQQLERLQGLIAKVERALEAAKDRKPHLFRVYERSTHDTTNDNQTIQQ